MTAQYDYAATASELGVSVSWLQRHIARLPHLKFGRGVNGRVYFTDEHIEQIRAMYEYQPEGVPVPPRRPESHMPRPSVRDMLDLRPAPSRPRRKAS